MTYENPYYSDRLSSFCGTRFTGIGRSNKCNLGHCGFVLLFPWMSFERRVWNLELQRRGLSSEKEVWSVAQFSPD